MLRVGLIVNPLAGVGGAKALKGSDGDLALRALDMGARPTAGEKAARAIVSVIRTFEEAGLELPLILTCGGGMGEAALRKAGYSRYEVVYRPPPATTRSDTLAAARMMAGGGASVILFAGGDGTARDITEAVGPSFPILGIPAGVKMYSGLFVLLPERMGPALAEIERLGLSTTGAELLDYGDQAEGLLTVRAYGRTTVPDLLGVQHSKSEIPSAEDELEGIAQYIVDGMVEGRYYIFGTGHTVKNIVARLGHESNPLGVDLFLGRRAIALDADDEKLNALLSAAGPQDIYIIVSPLGGNGFIFGRGNQQISAELLSRVEGKNITIVATAEKMNALKALHVDTGMPGLDARLRGIAEVVTGYGRLRVCEIV